MESDSKQQQILPWTPHLHYLQRVHNIQILTSIINLTAFFQAHNRFWKYTISFSLIIVVKIPLAEAKRHN